EVAADVRADDDVARRDGAEDRVERVDQADPVAAVVASPDDGRVLRAGEKAPLEVVGLVPTADHGDEVAPALVDAMAIEVGVIGLGIFLMRVLALVRLDRVAADVAIAKVELGAGHAEVEDLVLQRMPDRDRARIEEIDRRTPLLPPRPFLPVVDEEAAREGEIVAGRGRFLLDRRALLEIERGRVDELSHPDDDADAL